MTHEDNICNGRGDPSEEMGINGRWQVVTVTGNTFLRNVLMWQGMEIQGKESNDISIKRGFGGVGDTLSQFNLWIKKLMVEETAV